MPKTQAQSAHGHTFHVPRDLNETIRAEADRTGADANKIVRYLLKKAVAEMLPLSKETAEALS